MFKKKTRRFLQIISVLLTFAIFTGTFTAAAEAVQNENTNHVWLIMDNLTETPYSDNIFNRYEDKNFETNTAEIFTYNESGEVDYTYSLSGSVGDATAALDLNFWHNTNDLGNAPYDSAVADGSETFLTETDGTNFMNSVYGFGIGWSLDIPQIEYINSTTAYFHNGEGKAYRIGEVAPETTENTEENETAETTYKLCGFPYDYTIEKNITFENEEDTEGTLQGFIGTDRYGNKDYFNLDGRFIKSQDRNGNALQTVTYDNDSLISSITENNTTISFHRDGYTVGIKAQNNIVENPVLISALTVQNNNLSSVRVNNSNVSSYTTDDGAIVTTLTSEGSDFASFEYEETRHAIINDSEVSNVSSNITGYSTIVLSNVAFDIEETTNYSYVAADESNANAVERAERFNYTDVPYEFSSSSSYAIESIKHFKNFGVQGSQRNSVISNIESTSIDIVNEGYDPADPDNTSETETNPKSSTEKAKSFHEFSYNTDAKIGEDILYTAEYDEENQAFSENTPSEKIVYDYTVTDEIESETLSAVNEIIENAVTVTDSIYEENEETEEFAWTTPETSSTIGRNAKGEVVYNFSGDNAIYYAYNANGSPVKEVVQDGLTYTYTYGQYEVLHTTAFDIYTITYDTNGNITDISKSNGDETSTSLNSYGYDNGNVISESYANGQTLLYDYTDNGNVSAVYLGAKTDDNKRFSFAYNTTTVDDETTEELSSITDHTNNKVTRFSYAKDEEGNITSTTTNVYSVSEEYEETLLYSYTESETQRTVTIGENETAVTYSMVDNYETDQDGNYVLDEDNEKVVISTDYKAIIESNGVMWYNTNNKNADGQLTTSNVAVGENNILSTGYTYDEENESISEVNSTIGATTTTLSYSYDDNENIIAISDGTNTVTYEYDNLQELIRSNDQFNNKTYTYEYDSRGNILSKKEYAYTTSEDLTGITPIKTDTFGYTNTAWADELTSFNGNAITYDQSGNPLTYNGYNYTWDMGRRLTSISNGTNTYSYTYDDSGIRSSKTINGVTTNYITQDGTILAEYRDGHKIVFAYDEDNSLIGFNYNDAYYAYNKNIQGDIIGIIDATGAQIATYTYDAWGNITSITDGNAVDISSNQSHIANINPMRYRGYYLDSETNYYYLQSRYYNPQICRFINVDDTRYLANTGTLISVNLFVYCENSPIIHSDPYGCGVVDTILGWLNTAINALESILNGIIAANAKELKKLNSSIKLLTRQQANYRKLLKTLNSSVEKLRGRLKLCGYALLFVSVITNVLTSKNLGLGIIKECVNILVGLIISGATKIVSLLTRFIPVAGWLISSTISIVGEPILRLYFTASKINKIATNVYVNLKKVKLNKKSILKIMFASLQGDEYE